MSIPRKIAYNVIISSLAKILSTIAALVGIGFLTRYLGQDGFGMYSTALAFFSFINALGDWGLYQLSTREISIPKTDEKKIMGNVFGLRIAVSLLIIILIPTIVFFLPYPKEIKTAIVIVSLAYIAYSFYQIFIGLFQKRLMMDRVTISELIGKITQVILILTGIKYRWSFQLIVSTLLVNMIVNFLLIFWLSRKFIRIQIQFDYAYWKKFLCQSVPLGLSAIVTFIYFKADTIMLSLFRSPQEVGIYSAAYKVIENVSFFPAMIVGLTMPMFSFHIFNDHDKFKEIANKNFKVFLILVLPLLIGTIFLADGIINIIAGPKFASSANVLRIIIFALGFIFFGNLFNSILIAAKLQKQLLWLLSVCAIFNISLNLILIPRISYYATAITSVLTEMLVVLLSSIMIFKKLNFFPVANRIFFLFLSAAIMATYLWLTPGFPFFIRLFSSPIIYFSCLVFFKVISAQEIKSLISKTPQIEA